MAEENWAWDEWGQWRSWIHANVDWLIKKIAGLENAPPLTEEVLQKLEKDLLAVVEKKMLEVGEAQSQSVMARLEHALTLKMAEVDCTLQGWAATLTQKTQGGVVPPPPPIGASEAQIEQLKKMLENLVEAHKKLLEHQLVSMIQESEARFEKQIMPFVRKTSRTGRQMKKKSLLCVQKPSMNSKK